MEKLITYDGHTRTLTEWAKALGLKKATLHARLFYNRWSLNRALATPTLSRTEAGKLVAKQSRNATENRAVIHTWHNGRLVQKPYE